MENKETIKYDKKKAKRYFILFKFLEVSGVPLLYYGLWLLGKVVYHSGFLKKNLFWKGMVVSNLNFVIVGGVFIIQGGLILLIAGVVIYLIYQVIISWIKQNWEWAKKSARIKEDKK